MGEILTWSYIPYGLGHCWCKSVATSILNKGIMISQGLSKGIFLFGDSKEVYSSKHGHNSSLSGIWHMLFMS